MHIGFIPDILGNQIRKLTNHPYRFVKNRLTYSFNMPAGFSKSILPFQNNLSFAEGGTVMYSVKLSLGIVEFFIGRFLGPVIVYGSEGRLPNREETGTGARSDRSAAPQKRGSFSKKRDK
ncbi:MAG: hypothetical protein P8184_21580 [Calditrichia bacterium]